MKDDYETLEKDLLYDIMLFIKVGIHTYKHDESKKIVNNFKKRYEEIAKLQGYE